MIHKFWSIYVKEYVKIKLKHFCVWYHIKKNAWSTFLFLTDSIASLNWSSNCCSSLKLKESSSLPIIRLSDSTRSSSSIHINDTPNCIYTAYPRKECNTSMKRGLTCTLSVASKLHPRVHYHLHDYVAAVVVYSEGKKQNAWNKLINCSLFMTKLVTSMKELHFYLSATLNLYEWEKHTSILILLLWLSGCSKFSDCMPLLYLERVRSTLHHGHRQNFIRSPKQNKTKQKQKHLLVFFSNLG